VAPGVSGGVWNRKKYRFRNFTATDVTNDLKDFVRKVTDVNGNIRIILTVSPVPLIATYEDRHVWSSTTYSKAALRVASDEVEREFGNVIYFPSYEVITSPAAGGRYYQDDLRQVAEIGVSHVMRLFSSHFFPKEIHGADQQAPEVVVDLSASRDIVCDEETIERSLQVGGFK
jgi:hypothetical protein